MKIKSGYIMREVAGNHVVVPTGQASLDFNGMITLNKTSAFLWKELADDKNESQLLAALLETFDVEEVIAREDISEFLAKLKAADLLA